MKSHATFDLESAKRIAKATRTVEGMGKTLGGGTGYTPVLGTGSAGADVRIVRITSNFGTTAYGKYNARALTPTSITYTNWTATTGAPTTTGMLGTSSEASADDVIFLNLEELQNGGSTYVLTDGVTDSGDIYAIGRVVGRIPNDSGTYGANANKLLVAGLSLKFGECE